VALNFYNSPPRRGSRSGERSAPAIGFQDRIAMKVAEQVLCRLLSRMAQSKLELPRRISQGFRGRETHIDMRGTGIVLWSAAKPDFGDGSEAIAETARAAKTEKSARAPSAKPATAKGEAVD